MDGCAPPRLRAGRTPHWQVRVKGWADNGGTTLCGGSSDFGTPGVEHSGEFVVLCGDHEFALSFLGVLGAITEVILHARARSPMCPDALLLRYFELDELPLKQLATLVSHLRSCSVSTC